MAEGSSGLDRPAPVTTITDEEARVYQAERDRFDAGGDKASRDFDRYAFTFASGALALSIANLDKFGARPVWLWCLATSWGGFAACILASLWALAANRNAYECNLQDHDRMWLRRQHQTCADRKWNWIERRLKWCCRVHDPDAHPWNQFATVCNWVAGIGLVLGVCCFFVFGIANLSN
jgi:hypothetical protein